MEDDYTGDEYPHSITSLFHTRGYLGHRESRSPSRQFQGSISAGKISVVPTVTEVVNVTMRAYPFAPASELTVTNPKEVQDDIRCLKVGKAPDPDGIPDRALKHLPLSAVCL